MHDPDLRAQYADDLRARGQQPTDEAVDALMRGAMAEAGRTQARSVFDSQRLEGVRVIAADEVGQYFARFPEGTNLTDVVSVLAPPFARFFVEFGHVPNPVGLISWGVLFETRQSPADPEPQNPEDAWVLSATMVAEWRKGEPLGPVATWVLPLDAEGRLHRGDNDGYGSIYGQLVEIDGMAEESRRAWGTYFTGKLAPALLAISFMHCKNAVVAREVDPPEKLSRRHQRKHGRPLSRYYVLEVEPLRRVLDSEGEAQTKGLKHALHICRGHFKTYGEDAPLLGTHTGTYWWAEQVRGGSDEGVVEKDYRIRLDQGLGRTYVDADEHPEIASDAPEHSGIDPDLGGRGLRAHNVTQNLLARAVAEAGYEPRRPKPTEPQFDLAWEADGVIWVAEVKSITPLNEERQLRLALGQVVRYRQLLATDDRTVCAMIATERQPSDSTWGDLLDEEGVRLVWPGRMQIGQYDRSEDTAGG